MKTPLRLLTALLLLLAAASAIAPATAQIPTDALATVKEMTCAKAKGGVLASFRLEGALGTEDRTTLESGIPITFVHRLTVFKRRALFFDRLLVRMTIEVTATLDTLTKQYTLKRKVDGVEAGTTTADSYAAAEKWLSAVDEVELKLPEAELRENIELRVRSEYRRIYAVYLFPWSLAAVDEKGCR